MMITIQHEEFDPKDISQLYYAAVIVKEDEEEPMNVSLTWLDKQKSDDITVVGYGIFIHILNEEEPYPFMYATREEMESTSAQITQQIKQRRNGQ